MSLDKQNIIIQGPYKIIGEIYSSSWNHYHETFKNDITIELLENPDIIRGTIEYLGKEYEIIYNEFEIKYLDTIYLDYKLVYIPKEGYTTTIILYMKPDIFVHDDNKVSFTKSIRDSISDEINEVKISLILSDNAMDIIGIN